MSKQTSILISGNGIASQIIAHWMQRSKLDIHLTIIERAPVLRQNGQGVDLRSTGVEIVRKMGVEAAVRERVSHEAGIQFVDAKSKAFATFPAAEGTMSFSSDIEIQRGDLIRAIMTTNDHDQIEYRYSTFITDVNEHDDCVDVTFDSGKTETYDMVIAAEGLTSSTRKILQHQGHVKGKTPGDATGKRAFSEITALYTMKRLPSDSQYARIFQMPGGKMMFVRPVDDDRCSVFLGICDSGRWDELHGLTRAPLDKAKARFRAEFKDSTWAEAPRILDAMDAADDAYVTEIAQMHLDRWSSPSGRVALVGDAAYCPSAFTGLGTTAAFYGSYVLSWAITRELQTAQAAGRKPDFAAACSTYETTARKHIEECQQLLPGTPGAFNPQTEWGLFVSRNVVWLISWGYFLVGPALNTILSWVLKDVKVQTVPEWMK